METTILDYASRQLTSIASTREFGAISPENKRKSLPVKIFCVPFTRQTLSRSSSGRQQDQGDRHAKAFFHENLEKLVT